MYGSCRCSFVITELIGGSSASQQLEPPPTLVCSHRHLELEGYPVEQGAEIEIPLLPPGSREAARGFG